MKLGFLLIGIFISCTTLFTTQTAAQARDYFTEQEIEMIREAQQIDQRIDLLTKMIDRRFALLKIDVGAAKMSQKDADKWGKLPEGSQTDLFSDIKNILQKAIDDIDNLSARPDSMVILPDERNKKPKGFSDLFPKAVRSLAKAAERYKPALRHALDTSKDDRENGMILHSIEMCDDITASVSKLK